jgi:dihydrofolate reductase
VYVCLRRGTYVRKISSAAPKEPERTHFGGLAAQVHPVLPILVHYTLTHITMPSTCSVFCGVSLDGFIARPDGALDFLEGDGSAELGDNGYEAFVAGIDAIFMGRKSFEKVMTFATWPYMKKVIVLSSSDIDLSAARARGADVERLNGSPAQLVAHLAAKNIHRLYIDGGATVQGFLRAGLIDRLIITHVPVLIGQGIPLFGVLDKDVPWRLVLSQRLPGGLVQSEYVPRAVA